MPKMNPADFSLILLDRDGVINIDSADYIRSAAQWHPLPGSLEAIAHLQSKYLVAVCTNQSGVGRGYYSETELAEIHDKLNACLVEQGGKALDIFYCPHHPEDNCSCRKPEPELLLTAIKAFSCSPAETLYVGDSSKDLIAATNAQCHSALVLTGNGAVTAASQESKRAVAICDDLTALADLLLNV